ncbi:type IIL restriction-modification enzyme MmeI [Eoetvoesiella caeni]|uniref:type IIL restriction-modification enzyme MmeI n=1 Tax=Eoetvoesiella caeni TaxID=645616 RepID=UPI0035E94F43
MSSERRSYIPIDILSSNKIPIAPNFFVENGGLFEFGILTSEMHSDWMRAVGGRRPALSCPALEVHQGGLR